MSSRKVKINGVMSKFTFNKSKKYKYNKQGNLEEATVINDDDIIMSGSKSSLRRMADIERNISILATKLTTTDGEALDADDTSFGNTVNSNTRFKKDVRFSSDVSIDSGDTLDINGTLRVDGALSLGSSAASTIDSRIDTKINSLVAGAPAALNTLNELAAAIGDNASYAASVTTALGNKVSIGSSEYVKGATVSNDTITFTRGNNTTFSVTTSDANSNTYVTGAAFSTTNGVLTLTRNSGSVTVDLDGRYQTAGSYATTNSAQVLRATDAITVSDDTITIHKGDGTSESVTTSDANSNTYLTGAAFSTTNGVLTLTRNSGSVTVDLDGRYQTAGSYATTNSAQVMRATDALTVSNDTITIHKGDGTSESVSISDANTNTWRAVVNGLTSTATDQSLSAAQGKVLKDLVDTKATPADITTAINNLVDGAPAALNTLNELAAAIGDNASYASSITTSLSGKASTGTTMTAGAGLTGGGNLGANRTFNVGGGNGITVSADGVAMSGSFTGDFTASGDITAYSDDSLKTNVQVIDGALGRVEAIRGVTFERIEDGSVSTGVIAQELEAVLPEAVKTDANGVRHVAYGNITGLLIEAVKELSAQVAELKASK